MRIIILVVFAHNMVPAEVPFPGRAPARLILATPLVYVSGLSVAAANGVPT